MIHLSKEDAIYSRQTPTLKTFINQLGLEFLEAIQSIEERPKHYASGGLPSWALKLCRCHVSKIYHENSTFNCLPAFDLTDLHHHYHHHQLKYSGKWTWLQLQVSCSTILSSIFTWTRGEFITNFPKYGPLLLNLFINYLYLAKSALIV